MRYHDNFPNYQLINFIVLQFATHTKVWSKGSSDTETDLSWFVRTICWMKLVTIEFKDIWA